MNELKLKSKNFEPWLGIRHGHLQTVLGHIVPSMQIKQRLEKSIILLSDGDQLSVFSKDVSSDFVVLVSHGLGGDFSSDYMIRTLYVTEQLNLSCVLINQRGADKDLPVQKSYHSGRGDDYGAIVKWARQKFSGKKIIAIGFSMSGSILLNLLSGRCGDDLPDYAITVNAPLKLGRSAYQLTEGFNRIYDLRFYLILKPLVERKMNIKLPTIGRTIDIDDVYTSKVNGFKDKDDYYEKCSVWPVLNQIKTKTFVLMSEDDPFVSVEDYRKAIWSDSIEVNIQNSGGHMGYFSQRSHDKYGHRWQDVFIDEILRKIISEK